MATARPMYPSWLDVRVPRAGAGGIKTLSASGGRVKDVRFRRAAD